MEKLENQTIYRCSYCRKKYLSQSGVKKHEAYYCKSDESPAGKALQEKQKNCAHENTETEYSYIPGECAQQPECDVCLDCGLKF